MTPGMNSSRPLSRKRGLVVQELLPPTAHDVLRDVDRDDVAGARLAELLDVADHGSYELAIGRVDDLERDRDLQVLPLLHQRGGVRRVELDRQRLERVGARDPGVREGAHRRLVELAHQNDRVDARRQRDVGVVDLELSRDPVVVPADRLHQQEDDDHPQDRDPRTVRELGDQDDNQHRAGHHEAESVDGPTAVVLQSLRAVGRVPEQPCPVPHHAGLTQRERDEHPDDVELDEPGHLGVERDDQRDREEGQHDDAVAERQPIAPGVELARHVAVPREDRAQDREAVERRVGRQEQDEPGCDRDDEEAGREVVEDHLRQLADDRVLVIVVADRAAVRSQELFLRILGDADIDDVGEHDDRERERRSNCPEDQECRRSVLALGLSEGGDSVGDGLDAGQGRTAGGERPQEQEGECQSTQTRHERVLRQDLEVRGRGVRQAVPEELANEPPRDHAEHRDDEDIRRDREGGAGLLGATKVDRRQQDHARHRDGDLVPLEDRDRAREVLGGRRDRHRDREDVVDPKGAGDAEPGVGSKVDGGDLVVTATTLVGLHVLAVGRHHRQHDEGDDQADLPRVRVGAHAGERQRQEDLVRGVRHRGQRIAREDRQRNALGEKRLAELRAAELASDQRALGDLGDTHER